MTEVLQWFKYHTLGWPLFTAGSLLLGVAATVAVRRTYQRWLPSIFLAAWIATCAAGYLYTDIHRFFSDDRPMWGAQTFTLGVVCLIPLAAALLVALWAQLRHVAAVLHGTIAVCAGIMTIPLTNYTSALLHSLLHPLIRAGG
ncbi:MAG: hypothetical protein GTO22_00695 [Gemmatimonadales bacterium]|nr:hypothetical protein [Gemmatimonadales bacterium]